MTYLTRFSLHKGRIRRVQPVILCLRVRELYLKIVELVCDAYKIAVKEFSHFQVIVKGTFWKVRAEKVSQ